MKLLDIFSGLQAGPEDPGTLETGKGPQAPDPDGKRFKAGAGRGDHLAEGFDPGLFNVAQEVKGKVDAFGTDPADRAVFDLPQLRLEGLNSLPDGSREGSGDKGPDHFSLSNR